MSIFCCNFAVSKNFIIIKTDYTYEQVKEELAAFHYDQYHLIDPRTAIAFRNVFFRHKYDRLEYYGVDTYYYEQDLSKEGLLLMFNTGWLKEPAFVNWYLFNGVTHIDGLVALDRFLACIDDQQMRVAIAQHVKDFVYPEQSLFALILEREKIALAATQKVQEKPQVAVTEYRPAIPRKGDYNGVREYVEERKKYDEIFKQYCLTHNRKELCQRLSDEFGWTVDDNSYGKNISRNM